MLASGVAGLRDAKNPGKHGLINDFAAWGDPLEICADIQAEIDAAPMRHIKYTALTSSWIIYDEASEFFVVPIQEVVWCYRSTTDHYSRGTKSYTSYAVELH